MAVPKRTAALANRGILAMTLGSRWHAAMQGRAIRLALAVLLLSYCHMHLLGGFVVSAVAGSYTAADETELRDAINAAA